MADVGVMAVVAELYMHMRTSILNERTHTPTHIPIHTHTHIHIHTQRRLERRRAWQQSPSSETQRKRRARAWFGHERTALGGAGFLVE